MSKGKEVAVQNGNGTAVALPEDMVSRLAEYAKQTQQTEVMQGQFFGTRAGVLTFNKQPLPNNSMDVVVLRSMFENVYYPEAFNPNAIESPLCFAFSQTGVDMVPHADATVQQSDACTGCPQLEWKLHPDGKRRKSCKETRRLSCMPVSATESAGKVKDSTVGYLRVPVTSVKHWQAYAQKLAAGGIPPFAAVTRVTVSPDPATQIKISFECLRTITDPDVLAELFKRHDAEAERMAFPYEKRAAAVPPAQPLPPPAAPVTPGKF
jgi:hypothetical protein